MKTIFPLILALAFIGHILPAQNLEVEGSVKVTILQLNNQADSVLVWLPDGSLGIREVSSLNNYQTLSISGDTIFLTNGGFAVLPPDENAGWMETGDTTWTMNRVGIGTSSPSEMLEVEGAINIGLNADAAIEAGTIRWNPATQDFEGFTGSEWKSLTKSNQTAFGDSPPFYYESHELLASNAMESDFFGARVSISGDYAIAGAWGSDGAGPASGSAYIFMRTDSGWVEQEVLTASDAQGFDQFGQAVAISDDYAIVGASRDTNNGVLTGSAYIFVREDTNWVEQQKLIPANADTNDFIGSAVAIYGDYALVGAPGSDPPVAYVFKRMDTTWVEQAALSPSNTVFSVTYGSSLSLDSNYAAIGDLSKDGVGAVHVFVRTDTFWTEQAQLMPADTAQDNYFGFSVSLSEEYLLIGAYGNDDAGMNSGAAYIFHRTGTSWTEQQKLLGSEIGSGSFFGFTVSLDGRFAVISGPFEGQVYLFERHNSLWTELQTLRSSDEGVGDQFGRSVFISGNSVIVGAWLHDHSFSNSGSAYIYDHNQTP